MNSWFDISKLTLVGSGVLADGTWEFFDGPHPIPPDDRAIGRRLTATWSDGSVSAVESIAPELSRTEPLQTLSVAREEERDGGDGPGVLAIVFATAAHSVTLGWSDQTASTAPVHVSPVTGHRYAVSDLRGATALTKVGFLDAAGSLIAERAID